LTKEDIKYKLQHFVYGKKLWNEFAPYRNNEIPDDVAAKNAAVALHVMLIKNEIQIILIERSQYPGMHSQQIAFPGGKKDLNDLNLEFTARRESSEEIGFDMNEGELIGELSEVYIPVSRFKVKPFVFIHKDFPKLNRNTREVRSILNCSLNEIDTQTKKSFKNIKINDKLTLKNIPGIQFKDHFIWGATALILHEFNTAMKTI
jgi:8-oxo-dGTP pyrophosphatase MutT (NUDIX family)